MTQEEIIQYENKITIKDEKLIFSITIGGFENADQNSLFASHILEIYKRTLKAKEYWNELN